MKKHIIILMMIMASFVVVGCAAKINEEESVYESSTINLPETSEESSTEGAVESEEPSKPETDVITTGNPYFFFESNRVVYSIGEVDFDDEAPDAMELQIDLIQEFAEGAVYHLHFEGYELEDPRLRNRTDLGYFYVTPEKIYYRVEPGDVERGEEMIVENALLIVQPEDREDLLGEGEEGWHDSIVVDGNQVIYDGYAFVTETATSYYESYVWEKGKGLVEYVSGYGAGAHEIIYARTENASSGEGKPAVPKVEIDYDNLIDEREALDLAYNYVYGENHVYNEYSMYCDEIYHQGVQRWGYVVVQFAYDEDDYTPRYEKYDPNVESKIGGVSRIELLYDGLSPNELFYTFWLCGYIPHDENEGHRSTYNFIAVSIDGKMVVCERSDEDGNEKTIEEWDWYYELISQ